MLPMTEIAVSDVDLKILFCVLQKLKKAGGRVQDGDSLWCPDGFLQTYVEILAPFRLTLLKSHQSGRGIRITNASLATAKLALTRWKSLSKVLEDMSKSLDGTIQRVTERYARSFRISGGFKSLPDEILAKIFEFHYEEEANCSGTRLHRLAAPRNATIRSSNVLASVCKRFRQIALGIPGLWEEVLNYHGTQWILNLKGRTQHPFVLIDRLPSGEEDNQSVSESELCARYLQLLHPSDQWRGLSVHYCHDKDGSSMLKQLTTVLRGRFSGLKTLNLIRATIRYHYGDDTPEDTRPTTMLTEEDHEQMSGWDVSNLRSLLVKNIIPHTLKCDKITELNMTLALLDPPTRGWDLSALRDFWGQMNALESLSLILSRAHGGSPAEESGQNAYIRAVKLLCLTSFTLEIQYRTDAAFVKAMMDLWNAPNLFTFSISLLYNSDDKEGPGPKAWLDAVFDLSASASPSVNRTFANVETFSLVIENDFRQLPPVGSIFRAFPRVRDMSLELPECPEPGLDYFAQDYLKDLRSLHLRNCTTMEGSSILNYVKSLRGDGRMEDFDSLVLEGCFKLTGRKGALRKLLGDKLVWRG